MKCYGIYPGIVIQNNDPSFGGRVKIFVPGITNTVFENWNGSGKDKEFNFTDSADLLAIIEPLKDALPWAVNASAMFGGGSTARAVASVTSEAISRPSNGYVSDPPTDAFGNSSYTPGDYSESEGGMYSIPNVGAHVFVFFIAGDTSCPAFFAINHGSQNWLKATGASYPGQYENAGGEPYVNKHILNSNKHTIEFIDDDGAEEVRLTHFSGSNMRITNEFASELVVNDKRTLIENDEIKTVGNNSATVVIGDSKLTIQGNNITIINGIWNIAVGTKVTITCPEILMDCPKVTITGNLTVPFINTHPVS